MTRPDLSAIRAQAEGLTDLCPEHLRQSIRHVQRNCDIECNVHEDASTWDECKQPDRAAGDRMTLALAAIPGLLARLDAIEALGIRLQGNQAGDPDSAFDKGYAAGRRAAGDLLRAALLAGEGE